MVKNKYSATVIGLGNIGLLYDLDKLNDSKYFLSHTKSLFFHNKFEIKFLIDNDSKKLVQEIVKLEQDIAQTITTVSGIEGRFIDLKSKKSVANMRSRLTDLAQRNNLRLSKVTKSQQDLAKFTSANQKKLAAFLERPMFNIELSGSYHDLLDFIKQLDLLPNRVVVTHFSLEEQISLFVKAGQAKPLAIKLTLSF